MGRYLGCMFAAGVVMLVAAPAAAQVHIGIGTPHLGVGVAIGSPRVVVVDRSYDPYYRYRDDRYYRRRPVRGWERRYRDWDRRDREYYRDVREARREYEKDIREARREYYKDIREAERDRRRW